MKTIWQMQSSLGNDDQHLSPDCDPAMRFDCVFVAAIKRREAMSCFQKHINLIMFSFTRMFVVYIVISTWRSRNLRG
jgi:hypothetical protein